MKKLNHKFLPAIVLAIFVAACSPANSDSAPTTASVATPIASESAVPQSFTVVTTGDILLHERTWTQAQKDGSAELFNFYPQFQDVASVIETADLALCHLETPIANKNENYSGYPVFNSPPEILTAVKDLGFDMCDQASNHSLDKGFAGIERTLNKLDEIGIPHTGTARTPEEAAKPLVLEVKVDSAIFKVGIIAYTYGFNGFTRDADKLWSANEIDAPAMIAEAKAAKAAGAQFVIAKIHWGAEYTKKPIDAQVELANELADSGVIDLIDGAHSHSVQPVTKIRNMWVAYSHGNFLAAQREPDTIKAEGLIVRWTITKNSAGDLSVTKVEQIPTLITDEFPIRILNVAKSLDESNFTYASRERLQLALDRSSETVNLFGDQIPVAK